MASKPRLFILDANALLHRAWHALPPLTNPEGKIVNATYGVMMAVMKLINEEKPDAFVACWDTEAKTFRHEAYKEYKAHREEQADELYAQIPWTQEGLRLLGVDSLELDGFEADDLLGTIALRAKKAGWDVMIVTGDRDALQLIQPHIRVMAFKKGVSETQIFDEEEMQRQYSLTPEQFLEYKAIRGDASDNIPGIRGIGEKGATDLLTRFENLKGIYKAAHDPKSELSPSIREKLLAAEKELPAIVKLVTIVTDVPIKWEPKEGTALPPSPEKLREFLIKQGFKSLVGRVPGSVAMSVKGTTKKRSSSDSIPAKAGTQPMSEGRGWAPASAGVEKEGAFDDVVLTTASQASAAIKEAKDAGEIIVLVARGAVGSLFGNAFEGIVIGAGQKLFFFTAELLKQEPKVKKELFALLADAEVKKITHDIKSELVGLESIAAEVEGWSFDTMLAAYLLGAGERNHDLPAIAQRYASMNLPEDASAFRKAEAVSRLLAILKKGIRDERLEGIFTRFELPLVEVLRGMERNGILIDKLYLAKLSTQMQSDKLALEKKMMVAAGREFNPASPSQLAVILFDELKLPTKGVKRGKTGYSTAAPELEKLRGVHPIIEMIEDHRELAKLLSTYVEVLPTLADKQGRVHTTFNQAVTATGRLSSTEPNLQNIPIRTEVGRKIRRAFVAEKGYRLVSCDYSQIELRLVAALANDEKMLEAFRHGEDIHTATAAAIWGIAKDEVTKDQRRAAKAINFGIIYGQGPVGLAATAGISFADAKKFIATYFQVYSGIKRYMDETKALAMKLGYVETLFGRRRPLPEIQSMMPQLRAQAERMAINMPVQGTAADIMKLAMIEVHKQLPKKSKASRILLQVHDELVLEVPEGEVESVAAFAKDIMENVEKLKVPIVVEAKAGENWEEMEKL